MASEEVAGGLQGAASGAGLGFSLGGPVGAAIGGGVGLLGGILSGGSQRSAREDAEEAQIAAGNRALAATREGQASLEQNLSPFQTSGTAALPQLLASILGADAAQSFVGDQNIRSQEIIAANAIERERLQAQIANFTQAQEGRSTRKRAQIQAQIDPLQAKLSGLNDPSLLSAEGIQDPNAAVLNNPFFQALQKQQVQDTLAQRSALGLTGSGGTEDILTRNLLQLGQGFKQQDITNLLNLSGRGQQAAAGVGAGAVGSASSLSDILLQQGNVRAASSIAQGQAAQQPLNLLTSAAAFGLGGGFEGGLNTVNSNPATNSGAGTVLQPGLIGTGLGGTVNTGLFQ